MCCWVLFFSTPDAVGFVELICILITVPFVKDIVIPQFYVYISALNKFKVLSKLQFVSNDAARQSNKTLIQPNTKLKPKATPTACQNFPRGFDSQISLYAQVQTCIEITINSRTGPI